MKSLLRWAARMAGLGLIVAALVGQIPLWGVAAGLAVMLTPRLLGRIVTNRRWEAPTCTLSTTTAFHGDTIHVSYQRASRRPADIQSGTIVAELGCLRETQVPVGPGEPPKTEPNYESRRFTAPISAHSGGFSGTVPVELATDFGAPSSQAEGSRVLWELIVTAEGDKVPKGRQMFTLEVQPRRA